MKTLTVIAICLVGCACAKRVYRSVGTPEIPLEQAEKQCTTEARFVTQDGTVWTNRGKLATCMKDLGWVEEKEE